MVEQHIRNVQVEGSIPSAGSLSLNADGRSPVVTKPGEVYYRDSIPVFGSWK